MNGRPRCLCVFQQGLKAEQQKKSNEVAGGWAIVVGVCVVTGRGPPPVTSAACKQLGVSRGLG